MKSVTFCVLLVAITASLVADEPVGTPATDTLGEIVSAAQANFEGIDTLTAIYKWHETTPNRQPRDGSVHFVWDQKNSRFRSAFHADDLASDTITTPTEFVRVRPGQQRAFPPADSRKYWSAGVLSPTRLFGTGDRPLWQSLKTYTTWPETNDRISITSSGEGDDFTYAIRMHYIGIGDTKVFVTRTLTKGNAFNPTLIVRSIGTEASTANLIDVTSWTYKIIDGIVIPKSISVSKFDEQTGAPIMQRNLYLKFAKVNEALADSVFDTEVPLLIDRPDPSTPVADSLRRSPGPFFGTDEEVPVPRGK